MARSQFKRVGWRVMDIRVCIQVLGGRSHRAVTVRVGKEALPPPQKGWRWVGPIVPHMSRHPSARPRATDKSRVEWAGDIMPVYRPKKGFFSIIHDSERRMARTKQGWWIELPQRPSFMAHRIEICWRQSSFQKKPLRGVQEWDKAYFGYNWEDIAPGKAVGWSGISGGYRGLGTKKDGHYVLFEDGVLMPLTLEEFAGIYKTATGRDW